MKISLKSLLIVIVVLFVLIGLLYFFGNRQNDSVSVQQQNFFGNLFPFGSNSTDMNEIGSEEDVDEIDLARSVPDVRQVADFPVSGGYVYVGDSGDKLIRYVERETGNIYETGANTFDTTRITKTTIPGVQEVVWIDENNIVLRYLSENEVETFYAELEPDLTEQSINGSFVSSWDAASLDRKTGALFTKTKTPFGSLLELGGVGENSRLILSSSISSWVPLQNENSLFVQTAPHSSVFGSLFEVVSGTLRPVTEGFGLVVNLNPDGGNALISKLENGNTNLYVLSLQGDNLTALPLQTLATKCAWYKSLVYCGVSNDAKQELPEDWELGKVNFSDSIWRLDVEKGSNDFILEGTEEVSFDIWQPMVDETGSYMIFINKRDLTLWSLRLKDESIEASPEE